MTARTSINPGITEFNTTNFWGSAAPRRDVRVIRIPHSTDSLPPLRSFLPDPVSAGGITCRQSGAKDPGKVSWRLQHVLPIEAKWTSGDVGEGIAQQSPTTIAIRPGSATGAMRFLHRHPGWMHMSLFTKFGEQEGTITFRGIVGAGFSGDGKLLVLARRDGTIFMGKLDEAVLEATYDGNFAEYLQGCKTFDLKLGRGGALYSCDFAVDFLGENIFLIGNCKATALQDAGTKYAKVVLVDKRVRVGLQGSNWDQQLTLRSYAIEETETWALSVRCFEPAIVNPPQAVESWSSPKKQLGTGRGRYAKPTPPKPEPGALGDGVSAIFTGMAPTHVQMHAFVSQGRLIVPETTLPAGHASSQNTAASQAKAVAPQVLSGAIVLDANTMLDWHAQGARVLELSAASQYQEVRGLPIVGWKPHAGHHIIAVQDLDRKTLLIYVTPDVA